MEDVEINQLFAPKVREFIPHDSRLRFGRLNHAQTDAFNRQNRTTGISEITP
jgi:hypothetical protein